MVIAGAEGCFMVSAGERRRQDMLCTFMCVDRTRKREDRCHWW